MLNLTGKTVYVFGVTGGIGSALAEIAHQHGSAVYGFGRTKSFTHPSLTTYTTFTPNQPLPEDLPTPDLTLIATGFLHNDNIKPEKKLSQLTEENLLHNIKINTLLPLQIITALLPKISRTDPTHIGVLSAKVGSISDNQLGGWHSYRMSKAALNMGLKTTAIEAARTHPNLTLLAIHPGTVGTQLSAPFQNFIDPNQVQDPQTAATKILTALIAQTPEQSGKLLSYTGQEINP